MLRLSIVRLAPPASKQAGGGKLRPTKTNNPRVFTFDNPNPTTAGTATLVGWLYSKPSTLAKYAEVYLDHGYDVVCVTPTWSHVMKPDSGLDLMHAMEEQMVLRRNRNIGNNNALHAFSMGAYLTSLWTKSMRDRDVKLLHDFKLQAYDSPVDYDHVPRGIGEATFSNKAAAKTVERTVTSFLKAFPAVQKRHIESSKDFWHKPLLAPSMWFFSDSDVISPADVCENVMQCWEKEHNLICKRVKFDDTKHVTHYKNHPNDYKNALVGFINETTGLKPKS